MNGELTAMFVLVHYKEICIIVELESWNRNYSGLDLDVGCVFSSFLV